MLLIILYINIAFCNSCVNVIQFKLMDQKTVIDQIKSFRKV